MKAMVFDGPDTASVSNPSEAFLEEIIFQKDRTYWRNGSRYASLAVHDQRGKIRRILKDEPTLTFSFVEKHGFFFVYFEPREHAVEQLVPFAGGASKPWVKHWDGQVDWYIPRACFVSRSFAWEIVRVFLKSKKRSKAVPWRSRSRLKFFLPAADGKAPSKHELA